MFPIQDVCTAAFMGIHLGFIKFKFQLKSHIPSLQHLNLRKFSFYKILAWKPSFAWKWNLNFLYKGQL